MSRHFKYEIDENLLRSRLNEGAELPDESAWEKLEQFLATQNTIEIPSPLKNFRLNINKIYILPGVFAVMIILFSLLLYNFISIRLPNNQFIQQKKAQVILSSKATLLQHPTVSVKKESVVRQEEQNPLREEEFVFSKGSAPVVKSSQDSVKQEVMQPIAEAQNQNLASSRKIKEKKIRKALVQNKQDTLKVFELIPELKPAAVVSEPEPIQSEFQPD